MNEIAKKLDFSPLFIGSGRLYSHLVYYYRLLFSEGELLAQHNLSAPPAFFTWNRNNGNENELRFYLENASHIYLCISDAEIFPFYNNRILPVLNAKGSSVKGTCTGAPQIVHFSGSLDFPGILKGAHPLMTFSVEEMYKLEFYKKIHFVVSEGEQLKNLLPFLPNSFSQISSELKPYYHTLCVLGGNFTMVLLRKMLNDMSALNIPKQAIQTYVEKIVENSFLPDKNYLTGPLVRKDDVTIDKNLNTLDGSVYKEIYLAFIKVVYPDFKGAQ